MKTFPDFTWEFITRVCEMQRDAADQLLKLGLPPQVHNRQVVAAEAFLAVLPQLQQHPQIKNWVPMLSMMTLRWFPAEACAVNLYFDQDERAYIIEVFRTDEVDKKIPVPFDNVADEIYIYITKLRDG